MMCLFVECLQNKGGLIDSTVSDTIFKVYIYNCTCELLNIHLIEERPSTLTKHQQEPK